VDTDFCAENASPQSLLQIRDIHHDLSFEVKDRVSGRILDDVPWEKAFFIVYPGAIYLNQGKTYRVVRLDLKNALALVQPVSVNYFTTQQDHTSITVVHIETQQKLSVLGRNVDDSGDTHSLVGGSQASVHPSQEPQPQSSLSHVGAEALLVTNPPASSSSSSSSSAPETTSVHRIDVDGAYAMVADSPLLVQEVSNPPSAVSRGGRKREGRSAVNTTRDDTVSETSSFSSLSESKADSWSIRSPSSLRQPPQLRVLGMDMYSEDSHSITTRSRGALHPTTRQQHAEVGLDRGGLDTDFLTGYFGRLKVTTDVYGYHRILKKEHTILETVSITLPPVSFETNGFWVMFPSALRIEMKALGLSLTAALHGLAHTVISVTPLCLHCDAESTFGTECPSPLEKEDRPDRLVVYDYAPDGMEVSKQAYHRLGDLVVCAKEVIERCRCESELGCPGCIQSASCTEHNAVMNKEASLFVCEWLEGKLPLQRQL